MADVYRKRLLRLRRSAIFTKFFCGWAGSVMFSLKIVDVDQAVHAQDTVQTVLWAALAIYMAWVTTRAWNYGSAEVARIETLLNKEP
jgi:hypothetical protein